MFKSTAANAAFLALLAFLAGAAFGQHYERWAVKTRAEVAASRSVSGPVTDAGCVAINCKSSDDDTRAWMRMTYRTTTVHTPISSMRNCREIKKDREDANLMDGITDWSYVCIPRD